LEDKLDDLLDSVDGMVNSSEVQIFVEFIADGMEKLEFFAVAARQYAFLASGTSVLDYCLSTYSYTEQKKTVSTTSVTGHPMTSMFAHLAATLTGAGAIAATILSGGLATPLTLGAGSLALGGISAATRGQIK